LNIPVRVFVSEIISSVNFFDRKNEKGDNGCGAVVTAVIGNGTVTSGRTPIADDDGSTGTNNAGFLINDKNKCRRKSSGISALSTSKSRNCRKPA
jgi:hypothetical protein